MESEMDPFATLIANAFNFAGTGERKDTSALFWERTSEGLSRISLRPVRERPGDIRVRCNWLDWIRSGKGDNIFHAQRPAI